MNMFKNIEIEKMITSLEGFLDRKDIIGYAAARNTRIFSNEITEYLQRKEELLNKYGDKEIDDNGNETGKVSLSFSSPKYKDFVEEITPYINIEHNIDIFYIDYSDVIGVLSGSEILKIDWMLKDKKEDKE